MSSTPAHRARHRPADTQNAPSGTASIITDPADHNIPNGGSGAAWLAGAVTRRDSRSSGPARCGPVRMTQAGRCLPVCCCTRRGDSGAWILARTAQAAHCSDGVYGGVAGLPHGRAYGVGSDADQGGDAVVGGGLGYREGDLRRGGADVIDRW
jgi:hypothetical protein